jgi:hypothetical protein
VFACFCHTFTFDLKNNFISRAHLARLAQVVELRPLDRDTMALLLVRHYEFPKCGIIKEKLLIL